MYSQTHRAPQRSSRLGLLNFCWGTEPLENLMKVHNFRFPEGHHGPAGAVVQWERYHSEEGGVIISSHLCIVEDIYSKLASFYFFR